MRLLVCFIEGGFSCIDFTTIYTNLGKKDGMKQGPLGGALKDLGYTSEQVSNMNKTNIYVTDPLCSRSSNSRLGELLALYRLNLNFPTKYYEINSRVARHPCFNLPPWAIPL